jgi:hypothetical protein
VSRIRSIPTVAATLVAVVAVAMVVHLAAGGGADRRPPAGDPPPGAALSAQDRAVLGTRPVDRGAPPPAPDPDLDLSDSAAVARAYLSAAHAVRPDDAGRTHLRAGAYAAPGTPAADVGVLVLDPPPPGARRTAEVTALDLIAVAHDPAAADDDLRRGYRAEIETSTGPDGGPLAVERVVRHVVLARQPDDTWLVTAESTATPDLSAGEHRAQEPT